MRHANRHIDRKAYKRNPSTCTQGIKQIHTRHLYAKPTSNANQHFSQIVVSLHINNTCKTTYLELCFA